MWTCSNHGDVESSKSFNSCMVEYFSENEAIYFLLYYNFVP